MPAAIPPRDEYQRLDAVRSLDLLDTLPSEEFDSIAEAAALVCETPLAFLTLIDEHRVFHKARIGAESLTEAPRAEAFCPHAILEPGLVEVPDATLDKRFADNPNVLADAGVRFYAAMPLRLNDGHAVGTLCVVDVRSRHLEPHQRRILASLGRAAIAALETRRAARAAERAQAELLASRAHWQAIVENLQEGFIVGEVVRDAQGRGIDWSYVDVNEAWAKLVGIEAESARGRTIREVFPGIEDAWVEQSVRVVDTATPATFEAQVEGLRRWYEGRIHPTGGDRFVITFSEITERRLIGRRAAGLLALADQLQHVDDPAAMTAIAAQVLGETLDVAMAGYGTVAHDDTIVIEDSWARSGVAALTGTHSLTEYGTYSSALRQGEDFVVDDVAHDPRTNSQLDRWEALGTRAVVNVPLLESGRLVALFFVLESEPRAWSRADTQLIREFAERTRAAVERRRAELMLQELAGSLGHQKLEAVGQLTGGIAHDFNNLLGTIKNSLEMVGGMGTRPDPQMLNRFCAMAMRSVERAADLTQRLLAFSRNQPLTFEAIDVNGLVLGLEEMVRRLMGGAVEVAMRVEPGLHPALVDAGQLKAAVLSLVENARDAMGDGGRLVIETSSLRVGETGVVGVVGAHKLAAGDYVVVSVTDDGHGMRPDVLAKAFDPFFTTKPMGRGAGLGLSMIHGFAHQSGGEATIFSREGEGTSVKLFLPRAGAEADAATPAVPIADDARGSGQRILVVEDEEDLRAIVVELLRGNGFQVTDAGTAETALDALTHGLDIDVLVTDIRLPGMNGRVLVEKARALQPTLPVLMMTGYDTRTASPEDVLEDRTVLLTKPFQIERLISEVVQLAAA